MAGRLYKDAVERQSIPADPAILAYLRCTEPDDSATGSQEGLIPGVGSQGLSSLVPAKPVAKRPALKPQKAATNTVQICLIWIRNRSLHQMPELHLRCLQLARELHLEAFSSIRGAFR